MVTSPQALMQLTPSPTPPSFPAPQRMLALDPDQRISAADALAHSWFDAL
jgi:serine/threonine protein kinase